MLDRFFWPCQLISINLQRLRTWPWRNHRGPKDKGLNKCTKSSKDHPKNSRVCFCKQITIPETERTNVHETGTILKRKWSIWTNHLNQPSIFRGRVTFYTFWGVLYFFGSFYLALNPHQTQRTGSNPCCWCFKTGASLSFWSFTWHLPNRHCLYHKMDGDLWDRQVYFFTY